MLLLLLVEGVRRFIGNHFRSTSRVSRKGGIRQQALNSENEEGTGQRHCSSLWSANRQKGDTRRKHFRNIRVTCKRTRKHYAHCARVVLTRKQTKAKKIKRRSLAARGVADRRMINKKRPVLPCGMVLLLLWIGGDRCERTEIHLTSV